MNFYNKHFTDEYIRENQIFNDIFKVIGLDYCEPIILTACCKFVNFIIENDTVEYTPNILKYITNEISMLSPLLEYLGDDKYEKICI